MGGGGVAGVWSYPADMCNNAVQVADGAALHDPTNASILLPPLFGKLGSMASIDREVLPLLECVTAGAEW